MCHQCVHVLGSPLTCFPFMVSPFCCWIGSPLAFKLVPPKSLFCHIAAHARKNVYIKPVSSSAILPPLLFYIRFQLYTMLVMSSMMLDNQQQQHHHQQQSREQHPRRNSFSSFVRTLLLFVSPSANHDDETSSTSSIQQDNEYKKDANHNDSLFMEMYVSFPALEDQDVSENNSCAAEQRNGNSSFIVGSSNRVLCWSSFLHFTILASIFIYTNLHPCSIHCILSRAFSCPPSHAIYLCTKQNYCLAQKHTKKHASYPLFIHYACKH